MRTFIFVFGSNTEGRHGAGAALYAMEARGAFYGQARGLQGTSYAIVTKELRPGHPQITLDEIKYQIDALLQFAVNHPEFIFEVSEIGCGLAGFTKEQIAPLFGDWEDLPCNIILPLNFFNVIKIR